MTRNSQHARNVKIANLCTIYEDDRETDEMDSAILQTREGSCEETKKLSELEEVKTLIRLTSFEMQNVKRRVVQLISGADHLKQSMNAIQAGQASIIDDILGSADM
ncbi:Hypothetical_protein [Hexamita inflata]|uniref:Hypothetical_protein n=1 Tax=Hexamita inflata TaxID=28002 RepID=A0AA86UC88_9EUKA|nr:Hypothetical protein HINF_LOCUS24108 [Hexamita inflata]